MTEPLTLARFRMMADAYGGVIARWPPELRAAATALAGEPAARAILDDAALLDGTLDRWTVPAPGAALRDRLAMPPRPPSHDAWRRARLWWSGIGIASALAGAAAGAVGSTIIAPTGPSLEAATAFGDPGGEEP